LNKVLFLLNKSSSFAEVSILRKQLLDLIATKEKETACIKKQFQAADKVRVAIITKNIAFVGGAQSDCTSLN
jgi:hypothetical protein